MNKQKHVAVLYGGWSSERQVSLSSGNACAAAAEEVGYRVSLVDANRDVAKILQDLKPDVALNALHGSFGEDGCVQGILEFLDIPYSHSGVLASALAMNKAQAKHVMAAAGIPVANHKIGHRLEFAKEHPLKPPYVIKPICEGSSYGVLIVREDFGMPPQELYSHDWPYGDLLMAERFVAGRELTCAVMGDVALGVIEIQTVGQDFYDYDAKYRKGGSNHILPAEISSNVYQNIQTLSLKAHQSLGCRGVTRADFRFDDGPTGSGELICLEVNTQPGMTLTSLVPELAAHVGHSFVELVQWMIEDASCRR